MHRWRWLRLFSIYVTFGLHFTSWHFIHVHLLRLKSLTSKKNARPKRTIFNTLAPFSRRVPCWTMHEWVPMYFLYPNISIAVLIGFRTVILLFMTLNLFFKNIQYLHVKSHNPMFVICLENNRIILLFEKKFTLLEKRYIQLIVNVVCVCQ